MSEFVHKWKYDDGIITFSWLDNVNVKPNRVYAFAFTSERMMLLVTDPKWDPACWLPGGGIEDDESPEQALARELLEDIDLVAADKPVKPPSEKAARPPAPIFAGLRQHMVVICCAAAAAIIAVVLLALLVPAPRPDSGEKERSAGSGDETERVIPGRKRGRNRALPPPPAPSTG